MNTAQISGETAPTEPTVFAGGEEGIWRVTRLEAVIGSPLETVPRVAVASGEAPPSIDPAWTLRGVAGATLYTTQAEQAALTAAQPNLGRSEATCAALIPIRKSHSWWELAPDVRRGIFEEESHHIAIGLRFLPAIARRLYQCRQLGEPFDFLTWFEYAPEHTDGFEALVEELRTTREWSYVEHEIDIRLVKAIC